MSDGSNLIIGTNNTSTTQTTITGNENDITVQGGVLVVDNRAAISTGQGVPPALVGHGGQGGGVAGYTQSGFGVQGISHAGQGVMGQSDLGEGVYGLSGQTYGGKFLGPLAPIHLVPSSYGPGAPTANNHLAGEVYVDQTGNFFICTALGTPGTWKQLATIDQGLHMLVTPHRVLSQGVINGQLVTGISAINGTGVPVGVRAVYCAVQTYTAGTLTLYPDGGTDPGVSNFSSVVSGPLSISNMFISVTRPRRFAVHPYFTGNVYIDVWGYVL